MVERQRQRAQPAHQFGADESPPVDRPNLSKDYLAGTAPEDWIPLRPPAFFGEQKIALSLSSRVASIDPAAHKLTLADGREVGWDALLARSGTPTGGELLALADGAAADGVRWQAVNCLCTGWRALLAGRESITADEHPAWLRRWKMSEGDVALGQRWRLLGEVVSEVAGGEVTYAAGPTVKVALGESTALMAGALFDVSPAAAMPVFTVQLTRSM